MTQHHQQPELNELEARIEEQMSRPAGQRFDYEGLTYDRDQYLAALQEAATPLRLKIERETSAG